MIGAIRVEIRPLGFVQVAIVQPRSTEAAGRLWRLYRALQPEIAALEQAARREGPRASFTASGGGR